MDEVLARILRGHEVPPLKVFARRQVFNHLEEEFPGWYTSVFVENLHLKSSLEQVNQRLNKLVSRLQRRRRRVRDAINELRYVKSKMLVICESIEQGQNHFAAAELRCLAETTAARQELDYIMGLIQVRIVFIFHYKQKETYLKCFSWILRSQKRLFEQI